MAAKTNTKTKQRVTVMQLPTPKKTESVVVTLEPDVTTSLNRRLAIGKATRKELGDRTGGMTPRAAYDVQRNLARRVDALAYAHAELSSFVDRLPLPLPKKALGLVTAVGKALERFSAS